MRVPVSLVADHQEHTGPVLGLTCSKNYVFSGGEDKKLCVWDRRARSVLQTLRVYYYMSIHNRNGSTIQNTLPHTQWKIT